MGEIIEDLWSYLFVSTNANAIYLNKQFPDAKKNLKIFKDLKNLLPNWMKEIVEDRNDKDNEEYKLISKRNNSIIAKPAANTLDTADKLGRGLTTSLIWFDEFAFLKFNDTIYSAALPAWKSAADSAKEFGTPYGIILTTTPNNLDVASGAYAKKVIDNSAKFILECFDMEDDVLDNYIKENSQNDFVFVQYSYLELGRNEEWLKQSIREFQGDLGKVKREILLDWPRSTDSSVFNEEQLDKIYHFVVKGALTNLLVENHFLINFYKIPDFNKNYILSCDVSGGLSSDNSAIAIIEPDTFVAIGYFKSNKIDTDSFKKLIFILMTLYFKNSILVIERNSYGLNIVQSLMKEPLIEPRIYRETRERPGEKTQKDGFVVRKKTKSIVYGVDTTAESRKLMYDLLMTIVNEEYDSIISPELYEDINRLERKKNGKIEASEGAHDDCLMAYLIFRYAVFYGSCFRDRFGISPIASKNNLKIVSSQDNFKKIENIIMNANSMDNNSNFFNNNEMFNVLKEQEKRIKEESGEEVEKSNTAAINSFLRMIDIT